MPSETIATTRQRRFPHVYVAHPWSHIKLTMQSKLVSLASMAPHDDLHRRHAVKISSDRSFGAVFAVFFTLVALWPLVHFEAPRLWAVGIAGVFALSAAMKPSWLHPLNMLWNGLGLVLNRIMSPVATGVLFYGAVTPTGLLMRIFGKDPLRLQWEPSAVTYWIERKPPGPEPKSMVNQF